MLTPSFRRIFIIILAFALIILSCLTLTKILFATVPPTEKYVDNQQCLQCHTTQAKQWSTSHHAMAMAAATKETVLGDFNQATFKQSDIVAFFFKSNDKYYVRTQGAEGKDANFEIKYTFGVAPIQQYLIALPGGRLQNFTVAWDSLHRRWFSLYPNDKALPGDILHWTGRYQNANMMCINCHTTNFEKKYNAQTDTYSSTWSDINVSCQACHGPGEHHVKWAAAKRQEKLPHAGFRFSFDKEKAGAIVDACGVCHSRRSELTSNPKPGEPLMDNYLPTLLTPALYHPDGQQQAEVYVYNSFRQSKMYQMGVSCIDCHNPHSGKLKAEGNAVCTQCHQPQGDKRFPTAAKLYDSPSHHFHKMGTPAAQCVSCHMPSKNYMIIHARPDHSIRIPRPDLTIKLGTPNACNACHTKKSPQWAAAAIIKWYGKHSRRDEDAVVIAAGNAGKADAEEGLKNLALDESKANILRATALDLLRNYGAASLNASVANLQSDDPAIRRAAVSGLEKLPLDQRVTVVVPLLTDPVRAVRIEAARVLSSEPVNSFTVAQRKQFAVAFAELVAVQNLSLDMPGSYLNLAVLSENTGDNLKAENYYLKALTLDSDFTPARLNLARLYSSMNRNADAERILEAGLIHTPSQGEVLYSLALILAEEQRLPEAVKIFARAVDAAPYRIRVRYNYGLALQQLGERSAAEHAFLAAHQLGPKDINVIYALAVFYTQDRQWRQAIVWAKKLVDLQPNNSQAQEFLQQIKTNTEG